MKILVSAYACIPNRGSEPGNGWNWTIENAKLGHSVWCFTTPWGKNEINTELKKYPHLNISPTYIDVPKWLNYLYRFQPFVYLHYLVWQYKASQIAIRLDKKNNFDLILHASMTSFQMGSGMWRLKKPFIFGPVGGGSYPPPAFKKYFFGEWHTEVIRKWTSNVLLKFNKNIRRIAKSHALILVANIDTYKIARKIGASNVRLFLDAGIPSDFFPTEVPIRHDRRVLKILWVGRIFPRKGLPLVLEALSKVRSDIPFQLTIVGDGTHGYLVPGLLKKYGLETKTVWKGQVPWDVVKSAYLEHHVFLFCSLRDTSGSQFIEAMAYALPVITLDHQGAGELIPDDAGIKIKVTTPDETVVEIAHAVEYMFDHPDRCEQMGLSGYEFAKSCTWENKIKRLSAFYPEVVRRNS